MANQSAPNLEPSAPATDGSKITAGSLVAGPGEVHSAANADPTVAAFFDIDNTVIKGASIFALARGMLKEDILKRSTMLGFAIKQARFVLSGTENLDDIAKIQESALSIVEGRSVEEMKGIASQVFDDYMVDKLWPGTLALARHHVENGQPVWLVSATPIEVAEVIADRLGLSGAIGTRSEVQDGVYTGRLIGHPVHGEAKAAAVAELAATHGFDLSRCWAYSDSANDIPMLSLVGNAVAINPDKKLGLHARQQGWQIRDFRTTNFALRVGIPVAAVSGAALGATVGSLVTAAAMRQPRMS